MTLSVVFFGAIHKVGFDWVQFDNETAPYVGFGSMSGLTFTASQRYLQFDEMVAGYTAVMEIDGPPDLPDGHIDFTLTIDSLPGAEPSTGAVSLDYPSDRSPVFDSWNNDALLNSSSIEFNDRAGCGSAPPVTTIVTGSDQTANFPMYVRVEYTVVAHVFEDCSVNGNPDSESGVLGYIVTVDKVEWVADGSGDRTTLYSSLTADFSGTPLAGGAPLSVAFTDASTGSPTSWLWDFGDGNTSTDQNPTHVYTADGVYTVALTATNIDGSDTETKVDYITVASPVADFSGTPTSGTVALSVDFTDLSTNVPTSWFWDFGDGGSSTSQNPTYVYNYIGTYTVTLTATNGSGSDSETKVAYITVTAVVEYGAAMIENCDIDTGGAAVGLRVADVAIARDNRFGSVTVDASAELRAKDNSYTTLVNNGTLQPLAGDRAVFDALNYQARHTNDVDAGIHWTQTELDSRYLMWFNVKDYGALGDGAANDTTAVQAALDAATVGGGVVYFPPGTYLCDPLTTYKNVTLLGDGQAASTIQANSSGSLITFLATATPLVYSGGFRDLTLDGDSTGTNGLDISGANTFKWERITVKNFTGIGIKLRAVLIGEISDSYILGNATGIDIDQYTGGGILNLIQSNLLEIVDTRFDTNSSWAIYSINSALLTIEHCDFEGNGTNADASTGSVYYAPASDGIGIRIANSWFEQTKGNAAIQIGTPSSAGALSIIENTLFSANQNATYGVYVNGTVRANNAICNAVKFDFDAAGGDFYADGASATITRYSCTGTTGGAGTIASYPPFGGGGTVTNIATGTGLTGGPITTTGTISLNAALNDLTDVDTTGEATGNVIYDNAGTWQVYPLGLGINITVNANKIRFGNFPGSNYLEIDTTSGNLRLVGDATAWDDMRITADVVKAGATAPNYKAFGPSGNLQALMFEAGHHDEATFSVQLPHQWKEGSRIYPHVHWTPTTADAGNVVWELEYAWTNIDGTFGAPGNMATDATAAGGTAWVHKLTQLKESGNNYIDGAGKTMSSMLVCRIHRNSNSGSDTLNKDVALLEVDFHFEIDSFGSDIADVKDASSALFLESGDYLLLESGDNLLLE